MGKIKKLKATKAFRNTSLVNQVIEESSVKPVTRVKHGRRQEEAQESPFVDDKLSKKILQEARKQQEDLEEEFGTKQKGSKLQKTPQLQTSSIPNDSESEEEESIQYDNDYSYDNIEINEEDEKALEMFMAANPPVKRTLADIIRDKLTEKETEIQTQFSDAGTLNLQDMDERVVEMYRSVKQVLSTYRSGKLPKAFKIIPSLANWEQVLYLTNPDTWTAAAMYQATRIFASNLKENMAQRFYNLVLLPRIRDDIAEYKKLNFHLYQALRKSLFKPGAFFKGIILPLCESGTCTLREAIIIGSVMAKNSIPVLHSSAAILKIAEMDYTGANSIFMRILLDKKYALPYRVIDGVVFHFLRFATDKRELPVLWHQCLLTFAQRYKEDVSGEQKDALLDLLKVHSHPKITPEIRRELQNSKCRGDETMQVS